jgi:paraquat-inducible protein A
VHGARARRSALFSKHKRRFDVPLALVLASVALYFGLSTPLIRVEKALFFTNEYSVWSGIVGLWNDRELLLAAVVFFFSFVFPIAKLALLAWIWFAPLAEARRARWVHYLENLGRWSMLDVFAVAILIVATKLGPLASVYPQPGVTWFCAAILLSMAATWQVRRLATR